MGWTNYFKSQPNDTLSQVKQVISAFSRMSRKRVQFRSFVAVALNIQWGGGGAGGVKPLSHTAWVGDWWSTPFRKKGSGIESHGSEFLLLRPWLKIDWKIQHGDQRREVGGGGMGEIDRKERKGKSKINGWEERKTKRNRQKKDKRLREAKGSKEKRRREFEKGKKARKCEKRWVTEKEKKRKIEIRCA